MIQNYLNPISTVSLAKILIFQTNNYLLECFAAFIHIHIDQIMVHILGFANCCFEEPTPFLQH